MNVSRTGVLPLLAGLSALLQPLAPASAAAPSGSNPAAPTGAAAALCLLQTEPSDGAADMPIDSSVALDFSSPIDPASVWAGSFQILRAGAALPALGRIAVSGHRVTFTPLEPLVLGNEYSVRFDGSVRGVDGSEWQGVLETHFQTREGSWGSPESVGAPGADTPELAVDDAGNALLLWQQPPAEGRAASVHAALFSPSAHWQALPLGVSGGPYARPARVVAGGGGSFAVTWLGIEGAEGALYRLGDAHFLGTPEHLGPSRLFSAVTGALFASGRAWVATNAQGAFLQVYHTEGDSFFHAPKSLVAPDASSPAEGPLLMADGAGRVRAFWMDSGLWVASADASGDWRDPEAIESFDPSLGIAALSGAGSASGDALLAWEETSNAEDGFASRLHLLLLGRDGAVSEARPSSPGAGNELSPALAMSPGGDALLTWIQSPARPEDAAASARAWAAARLAQTSAWSEPVALSSEADALARPPVIGVDPSGNGHAVWVEVDASGTARLLTARFRRDAGWSGVAQILSAGSPVSPEHTQSAIALHRYDPRIVVDEQGRALAVWVGPEGGLWSARFE